MALTLYSMKKKLEHVLSFSGGKDSTAMLLKMVELNMPIDEIRYCDCGDWEFPEMISHILKIESMFKDKFKRVYFNPSIDVLLERYKMPTGGYRWCTAYKTNALHRGLRKDDSLIYLGFASDESKRFKGRTIKGYKAKAPLIEWGMTEKDCLSYCYDKGYYFGGLYDCFDRVSCWTCPFKNKKELKMLKEYYPKLWDKRKRLYEKFTYEYANNYEEIISWV